MLRSTADTETERPNMGSLRASRASFRGQELRGRTPPASPVVGSSPSPPDWDAESRESLPSRVRRGWSSPASEPATSLLRTHPAREYKERSKQVSAAEARPFPRTRSNSESGRTDTRSNTEEVGQTTKDGTTSTPGEMSGHSFSITPRQPKTSFSTTPGPEPRQDRASRDGAHPEAEGVRRPLRRRQKQRKAGQAGR
ncbi:hypothetical protein THAOC_27950, partial [Thalassiosira oceanica]